MADEITYTKLLYKRENTVEVYSGLYQNNTVCIKILYANKFEEINKLQEEYQIFLTVQDHSNIVKLYKSTLEKININSYRVIIIMELYPEGDLKNLIKIRQNSSLF